LSISDEELAGLRHYQQFQPDLIWGPPGGRGPHHKDIT
jgi:hypothetical protein